MMRVLLPVTACRGGGDMGAGEGGPTLISQISGQWGESGLISGPLRGIWTDCRVTAGYVPHRLRYPPWRRFVSVSMREVEALAVDIWDGDQPWHAGLRALCKLQPLSLAGPQGGPPHIPNPPAVATVPITGALRTVGAVHPQRPCCPFKHTGMPQPPTFCSTLHTRGLAVSVQRIERLDHSPLVVSLTGYPTPPYTHLYFAGSEVTFLGSWQRFLMLAGGGKPAVTAHTLRRVLPLLPPFFP
mmetsp:Transcript_114805/g.199685  ORF Transcript_114805/g.199685 Transcript_114805/m.199685 type:complete len:242 (-) Transcript_114805:1899-2624(-)